MVWTDSPPIHALRSCMMIFEDEAFEIQLDQRGSLYGINVLIKKDILIHPPSLPLFLPFSPP